MMIRLKFMELTNKTDRQAIFEPLVAFNRAKAADCDYQPLNALLRTDDDRTVGSLWAQTALGLTNH